MKNYILSILLLIFGFQFSKAQERFGLEITLVPVSSMRLNMADNKEVKIRQYPQIGYFYQAWLTDRKYLYRKMSFQLSKAIDQSPITEERQDVSLYGVYSSFGRGFYLNHREFEDDFSPFFSYGVGVGLFGYKIQTYLPGDIPVDPSHGDFEGVLGAEMGFGFEKSLSRKWLLNTSIEAHYQLMEFNSMYLGLSARFLYRRY